MAGGALIAFATVFPSLTAGQAGGVIEEVVVTAQKREQNLQDVSIAVTALTGERLEALGVAQPIDIHTQVPNFNIKNEVGKATPTITLRGIGVGAFSHNAASPVGVYVDEVFLPSAAQMSFAVFDVERVEVSKGPQGTLFGRNTTAGAVSFVSRRPADNFDASVRFGAGSYGSTHVEGFVSGPVADRASGRLAFTSRRQGEGMYRNKLSGERIGELDRLAVKGGLLWEPSDAASVWAQFHAGREDSENQPWISIGSADPRRPEENPHFPGGRVFRTDCAPLAVTPARYFQRHCVSKSGYRDPDLDPFVGEWSRNAALENEGSGGVVRLDWDLPGPTLTTVTGYNSLEKTAQEDFDGSPYKLADSGYSTDISVFSQEVRLASNEPAGGRVDWMAGAVWYREEQREDDLYGYADRANHDVKLTYDQDTESLGVFLHTETRLSDRWSLIAGARYTRDAIGFAGETAVANIQPGGPQPVFGPYTFVTLFGEQGTHANPDAIAAMDDSLETDEVTWKAGLDFRPNDRWLLYGSLSHGYKSGGYVGFWTTASEEFGPFGAEFVDAAEVGFKATLADGAMTLNAAAFDYDYEDAQIFGLTPTFAFTILNAGRGDFRGGELELSWYATEALDIVAGVGYIDAALAIGDGEPVRPGNAPDLTLNGLVRYRATLPNGLGLNLQTDFSYQDDVFFDATERLAVSQDAYWLANARIGLSREGSSWEVAAWARNLGDERYFSQIFRSSTAALLSALAGDPRTYGIEATLRFQ